MGQRIELESASGEKTGLVIDINFDESYDVEFDVFGKWMAELSSTKQAQFLVGLAKYMNEWPSQTPYLVDDIAAIPGGPEAFEEFLTMLNENWRDR